MRVAAAIYLAASMYLQYLYSPVQHILLAPLGLCVLEAFEYGTAAQYALIANTVRACSRGYRSWES